MDVQTLSLKLSRSENLPVLPQVVSSVLKLADDPDGSPKSMEKIIERDPAIAAKILRVASSSYYGASQVQSIARAISLLGMNSVRSLVVGVAYQNMIIGRQQSTHFNKLEFWRHSLAVATGARILAKMRAPAKSEEVYVAGMMHDVGLLVLDRFDPEQLDSAIKFAQEENMQLHEAEQILYGHDHAIIGEMLADKWSMTPLVKAAVRYHHAVHEDDQYGSTTAFVACANYLAHQCGFTNNVGTLEREVPTELMEAVGLPAEQFEAIKGVMVQEINRAQDAFKIA